MGKNNSNHLRGGLAGDSEQIPGWGLAQDLLMAVILSLLFSKMRDAFKRGISKASGSPEGRQKGLGPISHLS